MIRHCIRYQSVLCRQDGRPYTYSMKSDARVYENFRTQRYPQFIVVNGIRIGQLTHQNCRATEQYGDSYTGRRWVGCYIWYSEEGPGRAAAPPSPLLAAPNVTAHPVYQLHIIRCGTIIASDSKGLMSAVNADNSCRQPSARDCQLKRLLYGNNCGPVCILICAYVIYALVVIVRLLCSL